MSALRPRLAALIERRLLINYRVDPAVAAALLPAGLAPQLVDGSAVAGICLIRIGALRPSGLPAAFGWRGEAAAHRIAVEGHEAGGRRTGVYVPQRHAASLLPVLAGGRVFPGVHRRAAFRVREGGGRYRVALEGGDVSVAVDVRRSGPDWSTPLFSTLEAASDFFRTGSTGWSPSRAGTALEGLTLTTEAWEVQPAAVTSVASSFFDGLPAGSAVLDGALLMTDVPVLWRSSGPGRPIVSAAHREAPRTA